MGVKGAFRHSSLLLDIGGDESTLGWEKELCLKKSRPSPNFPKEHHETLFKNENLLNAG